MCANPRRQEGAAAVCANPFFTPVPVFRSKAFFCARSDEKRASCGAFLKKILLFALFAERDMRAGI